MLESGHILLNPLVYFRKYNKKRRKRHIKGINYFIANRLKFFKFSDAHKIVTYNSKDFFNILHIFYYWMPYAKYVFKLLHFLAKQCSVQYNGEYLNSQFSLEIFKYYNLQFRHDTNFVDWLVYIILFFFTRLFMDDSSLQYTHINTRRFIESTNV